MTPKRRRLIRSLICPSCAAIGIMRQILYGMPDPYVFDFEKNAVGGCCMNGDGTDPDIQCRNANGKALERI